MAKSTVTIGVELAHKLVFVTEGVLFTWLKLDGIAFEEAARLLLFLRWLSKELLFEVDCCFDC